MCAYGYWTSVCDRYWNTEETELVCQQMGFPSGGE